MRTLRVRFDRGTLLFPGTKKEEETTLPGGGGVWDARTRCLRSPALAFPAIAAAADRGHLGLEGDLREVWPKERVPAGLFERLALRSYQQRALVAWQASGQRGVVSLATGGGKTRIAIAAIANVGLPTVVLCPTRALAVQWVEQLGHWFGERIGLLGDGQRNIQRLTVMTFESAYRYMDSFGDRFGMVVVDEVHHFGSARVEALECCAATARLGLTATAPDPDTPAARMIHSLVGPVVFDMGMSALAGRHLAPVDLIRLPVALTEDERIRYLELVTIFKQLARKFFRAHPGADYVSLVRFLSATPEGRRALRDHTKGLALASFPSAKRALVRDLLLEHTNDRTLVFTAYAENAYDLALDNLVPVIVAETSARERADILKRFRDGPLRAIATARVLNEGIDVPEARVAIVVAGGLGKREHIQRVGRVLRPQVGKRAVVYELVTLNSTDARQSAQRRISMGEHASGTAH